MFSKVQQIITGISSTRQLLARLEAEHRRFEQERQRFEQDREQWRQERLELLRRIEELEAENKKLRDQLALNSKNSSNPPSTDKSRNTQSLRKRSGRSAGGQAGHEGHHLAFSETPDHVERHSPVLCEACGGDLSHEAIHGTLRRQVFEIPPLRFKVTEHQVERKICPCCYHVNAFPFPAGVDAPTQYGPRAKALAVYLNQYQFLPFDRCQQFFADLLGQPLSASTIYESVSQAAEGLSSFQQEVAETLIAAKVVHFDETSLFENKQRRWLHSASTGRLTFYFIHDKRGTEGMNAAGILPRFENIALHDHWESYNHYPCAHGFCNAHHLRELTRAHEQENRPWAQEMIELLLEIKTQVDQAKAHHQTQLRPKQLEGFHQKYRSLTQKALQGYPSVPQEKKRGRPKQSKSKNLLDRLILYENQTLLFMHDFKVPFDNNQAERDVRMVKLKQKISGGFRSPDGAQAFCTVRGAISTARKQGRSVLELLTQALHPPLVPSLS